MKKLTSGPQFGIERDESDNEWKHRLALTVPLALIVILSPFHLGENRVHSIQMGSVIVVFAMLFVFFMRDVQLLAAAPGTHQWARLGMYAAINGIGLVVLTSIFAAGALDPIRMVHTSPFWIVSVLWHGLIWLFCAILNRRGNHRLGWVAAMFPAPVLLLCLSSVTLLIRHALQAIEVPSLAVIVASCWWTATLLVVLWLRRKPGLSCGATFALDFAGMTNATALLLVPLNFLAQGI